MRKCFREKFRTNSLASMPGSKMGAPFTRYTLVALAGLTLSGVPALAQQPVLGPGTVSVEGIPTIDRDRLDRQDPLLSRPVTNQPVLQPVPTTNTSPQAVSPTTTMRGVRFEGSTLDPQILANAARVIAGAPLTRETLQKLTDVISEVYAKSDVAFYSVSIPAQTMAGGVVLVKVTEARISQYKITKITRSTPNRLIDAQLQPLLADKPTHKPQLERAISLLRDTPGQTVKAEVLRTSSPEDLELALDVERKQVEFTLNVNNRGVVNVTTGIQAQVAVALNGIIREGDSTNFSASVPFQPSRYQLYSASHSTPIGASGTTFGLNGSYVRTRTRQPEVRGEAKQFGMVLAHPIIRSYARNLTLTATLDGINSENYFLSTAFGGFRTRALRVGASYSNLGKTDGLGASISLTQGIDGLGARPSFGYSDTSYRKLNAQLVALKQVGSRITAKVGIRVQYSGDRLPTTERFALGGEGAGLAYRYGVLTADKAIAGDAEASIRLLGAAGSARTVSAFTYIDGVTGQSLSRPLYGLTKDNFSLASAGGGLRLNPIKGWFATAQLAIPVKTPTPGYGEKARVFFSITRTI